MSFHESHFTHKKNDSVHEAPTFKGKCMQPYPTSGEDGFSLSGFESMTSWSQVSNHTIAPRLTLIVLFNEENYTKQQAITYLHVSGYEVAQLKQEPQDQLG